MREPHWHPITAEMGYVQRGSARMTVMDPDGTLDTWYLEQGDVYFIPRPTRITSRSSTRPTCTS
jgi:oxalate decarboxylase